MVTHCEEVLCGVGLLSVASGGDVPVGASVVSDVCAREQGLRSRRRAVTGVPVSQRGAGERRLITRGISLNYLNLLAALGSTLILTPIILKYLGQSAYGLWAIYNSVVAYLMALDLGMNTAVAKYTPEYLARDQWDRGSKVVSTVFVSVVAVGIGIALTSAALRAVVAHVFSVPAELRWDAEMAFLISGLNVAVLLVGNVFGNLVFGLQRVDIWKAFSIAQLALNTMLTVLLLHLGFGLIGVVSASLLSSLFVMSLYVVFLRRTETRIIVDPRLADRTVFAEIAPYSLRTFLLGICSRMLYYTDYIVIGLFLSSAHVAPYEIAYKLCFLSTHLFSVISTTMFPTFSRLFAIGEVEEVRNRYVAIAKSSLLIMTATGICLAFLGRRLLAMWVGGENVVGQELLLVLILMNVFHSIGTPACMVLQSAGRNKALTYSELANAVLNVVASVVLVQRLGTLGVALGTLIAHLCSSFWVVLIVPCRLLGLKVRDYVRRVLLPPLGVGVVAAAILIAIGPAVTSMEGGLDVLIWGMAAVALYGALYFAFGASTPERLMWWSALSWAWGRIGTGSRSS